MNSYGDAMMTEEQRKIAQEIIEANQPNSPTMKTLIEGNQEVQKEQETIRKAYDTACVYAAAYRPDPQVVAALLLIQELGPKLDRIIEALGSREHSK